MMRRLLPRSAFVSQDLETRGKWTDDVKAALLWGAVHSEDDIRVTILDINGLDDNLAVIVDSTMDGERKITSTVPAMDMEQSYEREWLKLSVFVRH